MPVTKADGPPCPHCDSHNTEPFPPSSFEAESQNAWYQCRDCHRAWSVPKKPLLPRRSQSDGS
jgi:transposase-like protein